ncbi:predicted protein [Scheffersomyces stipitis CBS 6054]|uniref:Uncharacterized protein n=1 Tax=Scheffersomyces stipitis (strain ATCC 58785 / CBS 6054 / NBRC 10063 / NRRL Y-11545) TaxID=322104 RepID=A3GH81_PICST|nr:predicted protein [Scheffersomyces stipitis CBS 6054]EAZ63007.2 predicted protein [Scheffersomyces stipitis CBS 6054]
MKPSLLLLLIAAHIHLTSALPLPETKSFEIQITGKDIKDAGAYVIHKSSEVKNNVKTIVKQKLIDRLLSKELENYTPEHPQEEKSDELASVVLPPKPGIVSKVINGDKDTEQGNCFEGDCPSEEEEGEPETEHVGYQKPSTIKNYTKDLGAHGYYKM